MEWLTEFTAWISGLIIDLWLDFTDWFSELWISIVDTVLTAFAVSVSQIPVPAFMQTYSMDVLIHHFPDSVAYFISYLRLPEAFALISAGLTFRLVRKVITLFQW